MLKKNCSLLLKKFNLTLIPYSPLAKGLLTGKMTEDFEPSKNDPRSGDRIFWDKKNCS